MISSFSVVPDRATRERLYELTSAIYAELEMKDSGAEASQWLKELLSVVNKIVQLLRTTYIKGQFQTDPETTSREAVALRLKLLEQTASLRLLRYQAPSSSHLQNDTALLSTSVDEAVLRLDKMLESRTPTEETCSQGHDGVQDNDLAHHGLVLVVDDDINNRDLLSRRLRREGYDVLVAGSGHQALRIVREHHLDLILLDLVMPGMDGMAVLQVLKSDPELSSIPVLVVSAYDGIEHAIACIEQGAEDYIAKPFNRTLLQTRVHALIERKFLRDAEAKHTKDLELALVEIYKERRRTEELLLNILPSRVANELRVHGVVRPTHYEDATIVFADFVQFTRRTKQLSASELVRQIDVYFSAFDEVIVLYSLEKLKTIGDCYMYVAGVPEQTISHAVDSILAGLELIQTSERLIAKGALPLTMRIGIHSGPVIAGVVGKRKFAFDVWGDTVNTTSRIEAAGIPGQISVSSETYLRTKNFFNYSDRGQVFTKDQRLVQLYTTHGIGCDADGVANKLAVADFEHRYRSQFNKPLTAAPWLT